MISDLRYRIPKMLSFKYYYLRAYITIPVKYMLKKYFEGIFMIL
jgi:hypothetical protein